MQSEHTPDAAETRDTPDRHGLLAFALYLTFSLAVFGRPLLGHFRGTYIGTGTDPSGLMWYLVWWPHALIHRVNPFLPNIVWAPRGINLAWTTAILLPSFVAWPLTASMGPIAAYNVLCLMSLPLAGWAAFMLCRHTCRAWWPSLLGGYIFGFSAYMLGQQTGHLNLTMVFLVPLAVLWVTRAIEGELAPGRFFAGLVAMLVAQFLISIEIFATMTAMGAMALLLGWSFAPSDTGKRIVKALLPIAGAYAATMVILAPYLYYLFAFGAPPGQVWSLNEYSADLLNFIVPAPTNAFGTIPLIERLAAPFASISIPEVDAYLGLPLILVAAAYAWRHWREPTGKLLVDSFIVICVLAIGPLLHFRGAALGEAPGKILTMMPLLDKALPARFMMYSFLLLAIIASLWFAETRFGLPVKVVLAAVIVISILPNLSGDYWTRPDDSPAFFTTDVYRQYLAPGENVLVLPFGIRGSSMLWQAETAMYFRMVGGYTGALLPEFRDWPIVDTFLAATYLPDASAQLGAFMARHAVSAIVVADDDPDAQAWHSLASACCARQQSVGGVTVYRVAPDALKPYASATAAEMRLRADSVMFDTLVLAADRLLAEGNSLASLTPRDAQRKGLLPASWRTGTTAAGWSIQENGVNDPKRRYYLGAWLGPMGDGHVSVGVYGSYAALEPIASRYRQKAVRVYFPYPARLGVAGADAGVEEMHGLMVIEFDREQLAAAAAQLRASASTTDATTAVPPFGAKAGK